ncbi:MBL fold metallo-hydrolase [Paracidovorax avenae]|uniref:MBL fold metallo-hydrolase n=1 Tax=Paracidovorax avenae TaxID=80867 RepID=UPI000D213A05|nr:MBL fold metallo-hydrolase [Paracidovorax avenae]AVT11852.1 MBL fold metallo-hydrolase [Paracidovorax avenae]
MPRPSQQLHPHREPAATRAAATVLLLRDAPGGGLEVLMTRRSPQASFAPGAYVFPGGAIDAQDAEPATHAQADRRPAQAPDRVTQAVAAIRESFEELGVLLARRPDGRFATADDIAALDRGAPFIAQCAARGLRLAADAVFLLAHWTADRDLPRRFDVPFLVARMPQGQEPVADETEQFEPVWVRPRDALDRHAAGQFFMIFPTIRTLERLAEFASADAVLAAVAHEQPLWTSCPRAGLLAGREARYMEHEAPYGELALVCPDGQIVHPLDWQPERPVPLLRNLQRLTAANPGAMTGPGTNSYLVGDPSTGYIAIDPGPADEAHLERLWHAAGGDIRAIVCTHSHADHAPGAAPLAARVAAAGRPRPPVLGLPSAPTARAASRFTPDRALADGEQITLSGRQLEGDVTHTLEVVHTPGHAANHLCLLLREDGLLFSGDHILNGSTTVIDPPDGNMDDYLASLDRLDALCERHGVEFILPAHGHAIAGAREAIARLKAHRLAREARVLAAMQALPDGSMDDWVRHAYADVPERLWPVAQRSLLAHVERLRTLEAGHA